MPPPVACPVIVLTLLMLVTEVTITSPFRPKFRGVAPAITAAAEAGKLVPRDARFEPSLDRPAITCRELIARLKPTTTHRRTSTRPTMRAKSIDASPELAAVIFVRPESRCCEHAMLLLPTLYCPEEMAHS